MFGEQQISPSRSALLRTSEPLPEHKSGEDVQVSWEVQLSEPLAPLLWLHSPPPPPPPPQSLHSGHGGLLAFPNRPLGGIRTDVCTWHLLHVMPPSLGRKPVACRVLWLKPLWETLPAEPAASSFVLFLSSAHFLAQAVAVSGH